jgi:hypothetical protein
LTVNDQAAEQPSVEQGSLNLGGSRPADAPNEPVTASAVEADPAKDATASEPVVSEPVAAEPSMSEPALAEAPKAEPVKAEPVKAEPVKAEASAPASQPETTSGKTSPVPGKVIVMSRGDRAWADHDIHVGPEEATPHGSVFGKRRIAAIAAMVALAIGAGALGGAFATATFMHGGSEVAKAGNPTSLEASLSRIDSEVQALKSGLDHTSKLGMTQFNKTSERLDKVERAQADPAAKLAKLSEAVDRLRAAPAAAPVAAAATPATSSAAKDVTGSIGTASAQQQAAALAPKTEAKLDAKTEVGRLPTVEGWVLRDVAYGSALIDSRRGTYEVYAGDMIPGLGRVDAIRRQDGHWVVVTSRGLIVAR